MCRGRKRCACSPSVTCPSLLHQSMTLITAGSCGQTLSEAGLRGLGPAVAHMAGVEGLDAHARAVTLRLDALGRV